MADTQPRHAAAKAGWQLSDMPEWLSEEFYLREIRPRFKEIVLSVLALKLKIFEQNLLLKRSAPLEKLLLTLPGQSLPRVLIRDL